MLLDTIKVIHSKRISPGIGYNINQEVKADDLL